MYSFLPEKVWVLLVVVYPSWVRKCDGKRGPVFVETILEAWSMAPDVLPLAFFIQSLEKRHGRSIVRLCIPDLARTCGSMLATQYQFLVALFRTFCFCFSLSRKYMMPLPNFVFTADYQNRSVGPTLFPEMRLSLQSVAMWIYAKSFV